MHANAQLHVFNISTSTRPLYGSFKYRRDYTYIFRRCLLLKKTIGILRGESSQSLATLLTLGLRVRIDEIRCVSS